MGGIEGECEGYDLWLWIGLVSVTTFGLLMFSVFFFLYGFAKEER